MISGLSGLISTFVNLYGSQDGVHYGKTTIAITIAATGRCTAICGFLTIIYTILKHSVKRHHDRVSRSSSSDETMGGSRPSNQYAAQRLFLGFFGFPYLIER
jgi:hypothetical protein